MHVQINTYWQFSSGKMIHKVIDVSPGGLTPVYDTWPWICTWSVETPGDGTVIIPRDNSRCWSWYGPAEEFLKQFKPL